MNKKGSLTGLKIFCTFSVALGALYVTYVYKHFDIVTSVIAASVAALIFFLLIRKENE